jgi:hypothetical protein
LTRSTPASLTYIDGDGVGVGVGVGVGEGEGVGVPGRVAVGSRLVNEKLPSQAAGVRVECHPAVRSCS